MRRQTGAGRLAAIMFVFAGFSGAAYSASGSPSAPLVVRAAGDAVALDGLWSFKTGDDPSWSSPGFDDSNWAQIDIAEPWGNQGYYAYSGFAWYRRHVDIVPHGAASGIFMFLPDTQCLYEVYWNGRMVGKFGQMPSSWANHFAPRQSFSLGRPQQGVLAVRVWTPPMDSSSLGNDRGLNAAPRIGSQQATADLVTIADATLVKNNLGAYLQILIYGQLGLLGAFVWWRNRSQNVLLWMALFFFTALLPIYFSQNVFPWFYTYPLLSMSPFHALQDVSLWYLLLYLLLLDQHRSLMRWTRALAVISILSAFCDNIVLSITWSVAHLLSFKVLDAVFTAGFSLVEVFPLVLVVFALRNRLDRSRWLVAISAFLSEMYDVVQHSASEGVRFTHWTLGFTMLNPLFSVNGVPVVAPSILSALMVCSIVYAVYRYMVDQGRRQRELVEEFKSAQEIQRILIPEALPALPGFAVTSAYRPAAQVGGDFFQLIPLADDSALLVVGDVSGKGLKAAMTVSLIVGALRTLAETVSDPAEILAGLNRRLHGRLPHGFVTCLVLRLSSGGECMIANAGHPAPFLNQVEVSLPPALPLGLVLETRYDAISIVLNVDDRLTLYTDGLLEARDETGEIFSFERLKQLVATRPDASEAVAAAVNFGQDDDITVLTLTRLATGVESTTSLLAPELASA
jgi:hypothetical protein